MTVLKDAINFTRKHPLEALGVVITAGFYIWALSVF